MADRNVEYIGTSRTFRGTFDLVVFKVKLLFGLPDTFFPNIMYSFLQVSFFFKQTLYCLFYCFTSFWAYSVHLLKMPYNSKWTDSCDSETLGKHNIILSSFVINCKVFQFTLGGGGHLVHLSEMPCNNTVRVRAKWADTFTTETIETHLAPMTTQ